MLSNGQAFVMDTLAFRPWETYNPMIIVNPAGNVRPDNPKQLFNFANVKKCGVNPKIKSS